MMRRLLRDPLALSSQVLALGPGPAEAQYSGHNFRGDYGIASGS